MRALSSLLKKSRKVQALLLLLAVAAAADAGFYFLKLVPARDSLAALDAQFQAVRRDTRATRQELGLYLSYDRGRAELDEFKSLLPRRSQYTETIMRVYAMARDDGMTSSSFGAEEKAVRQAGGLSRLDFSLPVTGSYRQVRKFIYDIETSSLFLNVDNLGLSSRGASDAISLTIGLSTYVRS